MGKIFDLKIFFHGFLLRGGYDYVFSPLFRFDWSDWALFQGFRSLVFWDLRATSAGFSVSFLGGSVDWFRVRVSGYQGCFYCGIAFSSPLGFVAVTDGLFRSSEAHYKLVSSPVDILHPLSLSLNSFSKYQWVSVGCSRVFCLFGSGGLVFLALSLEVMSQSGLLKAAMNGSSSGSEGKLKIRVPQFDNSALIEGYAKTLIGRCMNPAMQDMKALLFMLPRIWKLEERVVGADLGLGRFQFDFDQEEDIHEVLKLEPYHFDHWMLSLVRWEPVVDSRYPSSLKFWIRVMGVPLHFWADETFRSIGSDLGEVEEVDLDNGRVRVVLDGFKPLVFDASVEFHSGEETTVSLRYERLYGYCRRCNSLCHDVSRCPLLGGNGKQKLEDRLEPRQDDKLQSYKGAMVNGGNPGNASGSNGDSSGGSHQASLAGYGRGAGSHPVNHRYKQGFGNKARKGRKDFNSRERSVRQDRNTPLVSAPVSSSQVAVSGDGLNLLNSSEVGLHFSDNEQKMLDAFLGSNVEVVVAPEGPLVDEEPVTVQGTTQRVCKNLFPASGEASTMGSGSMELSQQEVLFSDALGEFLDHEFSIRDNQPQGVMNTILEENGGVSEVSHEEDALLSNEVVHSAEEGNIVVAGSDQDSAGMLSEAAEGSSEDKSHGEEVGDMVQPPRPKLAKGKGVLPGVSLKKRNMLSLTSPRKKVATKGVGLQGRAGSHQGGKPPGSSAN
ncbi:PREDICTED: uncharacterized protein LOC104771273 [Camelina sativa]|uniref:Uncharacterized protein LOC104771273 n=1 Tax=Camelina sativa TaxID=90675 RepID=A0ABM0Y1L2_CAMSA|nr:PREDICTED: uncharacterized protein LOC104771273 [Camelina sativa]